MNKITIYLKKKSKEEYARDEKYRRVRDHCHETGK